jgi:type I restriction enzyme S subunit
VQAIGELLEAGRGISVGVMYPGDNTPGGVPLIKVSDLTDNRINTTPAFFISPEKHREHKRTELKGGEVLLTLVGAYLGQSAVVPPELSGWNTARAVGVIPIRPEMDPRWIHLCLRSQTLQHIIWTRCTTTAQPTLNISDVAQLPIPLPPARERQRITSILGSLDDKIELNRRMNETLEAMARAVFRSWFVDFDPVWAKVDGKKPDGLDAATSLLFPDKFEITPVGPVPKGWRVEAFDAVAGFLNGLALQKYPAKEGKPFLPVIKIAQLRAGDVQDADRADVSVPKQYVIGNGDLLFSWSGTLEVVIWCGGNGALNQHLFKVTSDTLPIWFVYQWLLEHLPEFRRIAAAKATTMGHIQRHHLHDAKVVVPPVELLVAASVLMKPLMERIVANTLQSHTLAAIRDALLPKLLSGEISAQPTAHTTKE